MGCPVMPHPLCLVENTGADLTVNKSTLDVISQITSPLVVVAVAGPYRTGKSFLLNRLMDKNDGFALGSSIQSKTKGIWVWCRPHPHDPSKCLLLLDTEGLGDVEKGNSKNDSHIFALTTLLSSMLVYNNKATLENDALEKLYFVSELTDLIRVRAATRDEDGTEFVKFFPDFVWAIRDFTLELVIDGRKVTADGYLDHALTLKKGMGKKVSDYNAPRECLRTFFKSLKCFVFDRPVQDTKKFKILDKLQDRDLDPGFLEEAREFCRYIFASSTVKTYEGKSLNGSSFGSLLQMYVQAIQSGKVPCLENAYVAMAEIENQKALTEAVEIYKEARQFLSLPTETLQELSTVHGECEHRALEHFMKKAFDDKENAYQYVLKEEMKKRYNQLLAENEAASREVCQKLFQSLGAKLEQNLSSGKYLKPGGFKEYSTDKMEVVKQFNASPGRGVMAQDALQKYLNGKKPEGNNILKGDKKMTQKEKDIAAQREAAALNEQRARAAEEEKTRMEQKILDDRKSNKEHLEQLEKKMREESDQLRREQDVAIRQKVAEQAKFLREGHQQRADAMAAQIQTLEQQIKQQEEESKRGSGFMDFLGGAVETLAPFVAGPVYGTAIAVGTRILRGL